MAGWRQRIWALLGRGHGGGGGRGPQGGGGGGPGGGALPPPPRVPEEEVWPGSPEEFRLAREAVEQGVLEAEAVIGAIMGQVEDRRSREEISGAVAAYVAAHGEPRFSVRCYRCGGAAVDMPLIYPSARGLWSWMPPGYLLAQFNHNAAERRCRQCGAPFPRVEPGGGGAR